jgi:hypothetical protein
VQTCIFFYCWTTFLKQALAAESIAYGVLGPFFL